MVLLDADYALGPSGPGPSRYDGSPRLEVAPARRAELARLTLLKEEIEYFASWASHASAGGKAQSLPRAERANRKPR